MAAQMRPRRRACVFGTRGCDGRVGTDRGELMLTPILCGNLCLDSFHSAGQPPVPGTGGRALGLEPDVPDFADHSKLATKRAVLQ